MYCMLLLALGSSKAPYIHSKNKRVISIWIQVISVAVVNDFTIPIADSNDISRNRRAQLN